MSVTSKLLLVLLIPLGFFLLSHFIWEEYPEQPEPDKELYALLKLQRQLDRYTPLADNNLQGTHNSYNSDVYHTLLRYHDRQQQISVLDQLNFGARFIELDVHWTFSFESGREDLLLCHGTPKYDIFPFHWGCSPWDKPLIEVLDEVNHWLENPQNADELLIFYIEDHSEGEHEYLYKLLADYGIADNIFPSGGCKEIPNTLTPEQVLNAGKKIVFWKDGPCSEYAPLANLAYDDLGELDRRAEDRTFLGTHTKRLLKSIDPRIELKDVSQHFNLGANIVNFDEFAINDPRLEAVLWSWSRDALKDIKGECALMGADGRWSLEECQLPYSVACYSDKETLWYFADASQDWSGASSACEAKGAVFSAPTNRAENQALLNLAQGKKLWLNVINSDGVLSVGDRRQHKLK